MTTSNRFRSDLVLELKIDEEFKLMTLSSSIEQKRLHEKRMRDFIFMRSPEQIALMKRNRGLR